MRARQRALVVADLPFLTYQVSAWSRRWPAPGA